MSYTLIEMLAPINSQGARPAKNLKKINGVTIHMTDNWGKGADAIAHANYLRNSGADGQASWHYCIDDTHATQSIPDNEVAYHSATYIGNYTTISIEICVNPESNLTKACDNAVLLAASLLKKYNLTINDLYRHYDWSGKWCPSQIMDGKPYTWNTFKKKVKEAMKSEISVENEDIDKKPDTSYHIIGVGTIVNFDGKTECYSASNGGTAGVVPPAGKYEVTYYNPGALFPVHIGTYGWVSADNCSVDNTSTETIHKNLVGTIVTFNGKEHCHATSEGMGIGMIPPAGKYEITHYNRNGKYPIHIGTYGWVSAESCGLDSKIATRISVGKSVRFDGLVRCHARSNGGTAGVLPAPGVYKVTHYNEGAKYAVHIGNLGWVCESHCRLV